MALDLEEQEQLDEFKAWWNQYGKMVTNVVVALIALYVAYIAWNAYQHKQAAAASTLYQTLLTTDVKDTKSVQSQTSRLIADYARTPYAGRAAVYSAKINYEAKEVKSAKNQLEWAAKNAKESAVQAIAHLQLANILLEEKAYDAALSQLNVNPDAAYAGLYADLKGDILLTMGKTAEAKAAYALALEKLDAQGRYRFVTQQKLATLG